MRPTRIRDEKMKRTFLWLFLVLGITTTMFCSCSKDDESGNISGDTSTITASNVINSSSQIETVKALAFPDNDYDEEGESIALAQYKNNGFTLELPSTLSSKYLSLIWEDAPNGISISDENAKISEIDISGYNDDDDEIGGFFLCNEDDETDWSYDVFWIYSDRDVTIKGESTAVDYENDEENTTKYDLKLNKGWNIVHDIYTYNSNDKTGYTDVVTSKKPSGFSCSWYFEKWGGDFMPAQVAKSTVKQKSFLGKFKENRKIH